MKKRIFPQLDGLRAVAALMVVIHHYWPGSARWDTTGGRLGVDIFFVLSGYLITRTLLNANAIWPEGRSMTLKKFYTRRIRRIFPVYYVTLALAATIPSQRTIALLWHAAFLSNLLFILKGRFVGAGGHLWALAVEQHFYLFWPLAVLWIPRRKLSSAALLMIGTGLLFRMIGGLREWSNVTMYVMTPGAFEALGAGAWLAVWMERREDAPERLGRWTSAVGLAGLVLWGLRIGTVDTAVGPVCSLLFTELSRSLMLTWVIAQAVWGIPGWIGGMLESAPARALGRWSYAIYLCHNFFFAMFKARPRHLPGLSIHDSQAVLALAVTLIWSAACYHLLEKPVLTPTPVQRDMIPA
jgi:peptidoglycan/LPS O-acetylase OafA/YrhL